MANPTETTNARAALETMVAESVADRNADIPMPADIFDTATDIPCISWDDGSCTIVVEGSRSHLIDFFHHGLMLAQRLDD